MWTAKRMSKEYSWTPVSYIEPAKPQFQVGYHQQLMSEVLPSELDLLSFWLTGTLTAVTSPGVMSRRYCNMCELRWYSASLAPYGTEQEGTSQTPLGVKPTTQ